jgi:hypothetical protein
MTGTKQRCDFVVQQILIQWTIKQICGNLLSRMAVEMNAINILHMQISPWNRITLIQLGEGQVS